MTRKKTVVYPSVTIIFPTRNGWQETEQCLGSIQKLKYPPEKIEVIAVDNGSRNIKYLGQGPKSNISNLKIILNKKNLGFAKAVNQGIKKAKGEYILVTNNDVVFDKDYLANLINFLQNNPKAGIVGGKVYFKKPCSKNEVAFAGAKFNFYTGILTCQKKERQAGKTAWLPGCNMLIRRPLLEKTGYFDEKFFFYFEDVDFCLRARKAGFQVFYYPKAKLWHGEGKTIEKKSWQKKFEYYYQGKTRLIFKHASKLQLISSLFCQFSLFLPWYVLTRKRQAYPIAYKALMKTIADFRP